MVKQQEDILNLMIKGIRLFVLDKIVPEYQEIKAHPDSTTGLGTSVYTDDVGAPFSTCTHCGKLGYYQAIFTAYHSLTYCQICVTIH